MPENNNIITPSGTHKTKRQWRVGTFSMGTVLIVFGLVLLFAQFRKISAVELVFTWWPVIMIILGLEILAAYYFSGEDTPPIKYDFLSITMVLLIVGVTLGLYGLTSMGILPAIVENFGSGPHRVEVPEQRFVLKDGIKNIVVDGSGTHSILNRLYVQEGESGQVVALAQAEVSAKSEEDAAALVPDSLVDAHRVGDTLFLDLKSVPAANRFQYPPYVKHTIILPSDLNVQIEADTESPLKLKVGDLRNNWAINSSGTVEATVAMDADVKVDAFARSLGGEAKWVPGDNGQKEGGRTTSLVKDSDGNMTFKETVAGEETEAKGKAGVLFGKGSHKLKINADKILVDYI